MLYLNTQRNQIISKKGLYFPPLQVIEYDSCDLQDFRILSFDAEWGVDNIVSWLGFPIALKRTSALGDVLITSAVAQALTDKYGSDVYFITSPEGMELLKCIKGIIPESVKTYFNNYNIKWVIDLDVLKENYEFAYEGMTEHLQKNRIEITYEYLRMPISRTSPDIYLNTNILNFGYNFVRDLKRPVIVIAPSSSWLCKMWQNMPVLIDKLVKSRYSVILLDKKLWFDPPNGCYMFIDCPIEIGISLLFHSDILLTLDSFWMHMAGAIGVPQLVLCSCTDGNVNARYYNAKVVHGNMDCFPCWYRFREECSLHKFPKCLDTVTADEILEYIRREVN